VKPRLLIPLGVLAAIAVVVAGCGSYKSSNGPPAAAAAPTGTSATSSISTRKDAVGTHLVDGAGRTLYLWQADKDASSTCTGACAQAWPPLTTKGTPKASGGVTATWLGTTKRSDGTMQVTYKNHPLYLFAGDKSAGDTNGQGSDGFGALWYILGADGDAITAT
jgi:predicted lipoprotein with Yx(FWY)xxD motif